MAEPAGNPTHFSASETTSIPFSLLRVLLVTLTFLAVLIPCSALLIMGAMALGWDDDLVAILVGCGSLGAAGYATLKVASWLTPDPPSILLDFEGTRVRYRTPTGKDGSAFQEITFENRGLTLVSGTGPRVVIRTSDGQTVHMPYRYRQRREPAAIQPSRSSRTIKAAIEGVSVWAFTLEEGGVIALQDMGQVVQGIIPMVFPP